MQEKIYDILLGEENVGKTAIFNRYTKVEFDENYTAILGNKKLYLFFLNNRC